MAKARSLPREPRDRYHFRTKHFEFFFEWAVGTAMHGGMATGESFHAACRMKDGDSESWVRAWREMGERVEKRADEALARGHAVTAREAYLRAYCHHRAATAFMDPFTDQRLQPYLARARACFRRAVSLMDGLLEPVEVPYQGTKLPGYFLKPDLSGDRRRTLLMIGGGDTYVEDLYYSIGPAGVKRGYNVLFVDLPGQGDLPFRGLYFPVEAEKPMAA
ncbi:MAG: alpha/beta hydrolase family protein, partial [Patescibacteria group bacterium]